MWSSRPYGLRVSMVVGLALLLAAHLPTSFARRKHKSSINAISGSVDQTHRDSASECRFGGKSYELEQTWHPDLGPPFGVMFCVHCECVSIHKKRRIVGRVRCKNIKSDCPKPSCPDPILLAGRCCKVCPGQDNNPDNNIKVDLDREEQEKNGRHYASILSGPNVEGGAIGRLYFRKKTLQWSMVWSDNLSPPLYVTFLDRADNILDEFTTPITNLYNRTGKMCGTWARLPRKYRRMLRSEELRISLSHPEGVVGGSINKYYGLTSELLSGFLIGPSGIGSAVVSLDIPTGSVHVNLLLQGLPTMPSQTRLPFVVGIHIPGENGQTHTIEEQLTLDNVQEDVSSLEFRTVLNTKDVARLAKGETRLTVTPASPGQQDNSGQLSGTLVPRISCDIMDCVLSSSAVTSDSASSGGNSSNTLAPPSRGLAFMSFNREGRLVYKIRLADDLSVATEITQISLDNAKKSRRLFNAIPNIEANFENGVASGELTLSAAQLEELLKEDFYLTVTTSQKALRGRILVHQASSSHLSGEPVLLTGNTSASGLSWVSLDNNCRLHYSLRLEGPIGDGLESHLELEDYPLENLKALPLFPSHTRRLQLCQGKRCAGHADHLHKLTLSRLNSGDAALVLRLPNRTGTPGTLTGRLDAVDTPIACLPIHNRNSLERIPGYLNDLGEKVPETILLKCFYEGAVYSDGQQWDASHKKCQMCSCQRGTVVCDVMVCPSTNCTDPVIPEGECCPTCTLRPSTGRGCSLGGNLRVYPEGSRWHPYIPPFGFIRCSVCTCQMHTLKVKCFKQSCPRLECALADQHRPGPLSCCKQCRQPDSDGADSRAALDLVPIDPSKQHDMAVATTGDDILASGGCKLKGGYHENGATWHPNVLPWGEMKCFTCHCKDGSHLCRKRRCPRLSCPLQVVDESRCCARCAANREEELLARHQLTQVRRRNHRRLRRLRHHRNKQHE